MTDLHVILTPIISRHNVPRPFRAELLTYFQQPNGIPDHLRPYLFRPGRDRNGGPKYSPLLRDCLEALTAEFLQSRNPDR